MTVDLDVDGGVATLTLARPDRMNAIDIDLARALDARVAEVASSDAEIVILRGSGRGFCAGGDVQAMAASGDPAGYLDELVEIAHRAISALRALPQPVLARVHGPAAGAGIGLTLTSDIAIASESATFTPAYGAIGVSPDCGGTALIGQAVGERRARQLFLLGERIDAATAAEWGLVARVTADDELDGAVASAVASLRRQGARAVRATKRLLASGASFEERLAEERRSIVANARTDLARERIARFAQG